MLEHALRGRSLPDDEMRRVAVNVWHQFGMGSELDEDENHKQETEPREHSQDGKIVAHAAKTQSAGIRSYARHPASERHFKPEGRKAKKAPDSAGASRSELG